MKHRYVGRLSGLQSPAAFDLICSASGGWFIVTTDLYNEGLCVRIKFIVGLQKDVDLMLRIVHMIPFIRWKRKNNDDMNIQNTSQGIT